MTFWIVAMAAAATAVVNPPPTQEFERGRTAFSRGEYERAVGIIYPLVYPELRLETEADALQAHRMLGVSYLFKNEPANARVEFRKLLELSPDFRFDPLLDPPRVVDFFNTIVREQQAQLGDIEARLKKREEELNRHTGQVLVRRVERRSYAVNYLPFGAGQFQNRQRGKAWLFLGVEAGLAALSLGAFAYNFGTYGTSPTRGCLDNPPPDVNGNPVPCKVDHSRENASRDVTRVQVASGAAFFAVAIWGIVDALRNFQAEVPLGESYVPARPPAGAWRLTPTLGPTADGGALTFTF